MNALELLGAMSLQLRVEDYAGAKCTPQLGALDLDPKEFQGVYAFGEALNLQKEHFIEDSCRKSCEIHPMNGFLSI